MTQTPLWTRDEVLDAVGGLAKGVDWTAGGVAIDSRNLQPGDLFVALQGPNHDAHDFVAAALANGASAALVHRMPEDAPEGAPLILVEDTLKALTALGRAARKRSSARIVAVTGSAGKTGTKEALRLVLSPFGKVSASVSSFNNHWGVPLSLARMPRDAEFGVFELGMNHPGEIRDLVDLVQPEVAVITTIARAHLAFFKTGAAIAEAKAEIFEGVQPGGAAILNASSEYYGLLRARAEACGVTRFQTFGKSAEAQLRLVNAELYARCSAVSALIGGKPFDYSLAVPGEHWVMNSLAVLAVVRALGLDLTTAAAQFTRLKVLKGRGSSELVSMPEGAFELIDDSYNANPESMRAALSVLGRSKPREGSRRIAILGDMLELGSESRSLHAGLAKPLLEADVDLLFACGADMTALFEALPADRRGAHARDSVALLPIVQAAVKPGDVVMVKGSLGSRMAVIVEGLRTLDRKHSDNQPLRAANGR